MIAQELRIGNYVSLNEKNYKVVDISLIEDVLGYKYLLKIQDQDDVVIESDLDDLSPISFNFDWTNKFKLNYDARRYRMKTNHWFSIETFAPGGGSVWIDDKQTRLFDYVHELQNITFSMTKKEL